MPYDTPYNRMIANNRINTDNTYSNLHAYSNQMYNGRGVFGQGRVSFPDRDGSVVEPTMLSVNPSNYEGGITHRNLEGCGGAMGRTFNHLGMGEDARRLSGPRRLFFVPPFEDKKNSDIRGTGKCESESESDEEMEGDGFFDDAWKGIKNVASKLDPADIIKYGKEGYDLYNKYKGKGDLSLEIHHKHKGGNMNLDIDPFASPMTQAVMRNNGSTSGPIGMGVSGGKRKASSWIEHVKAFAKAKNMNYRDALRSPECKASYKKKGKGVSGGSVLGGPFNDPVNKGKITGLGKKTGSALFAPKGEFALTEKTSNISPIEDVMPDTKPLSLGKVKGGASTEFPRKYNKSTGHKWEGATLGAGFPSDDPIITPQDIFVQRKVTKKGAAKVGSNPATYTPLKKLGSNPATYTPKKKIGANPATYSKTPLIANGVSGGKRGRPRKVLGGSKRKAEDEKPKTKEEEKVTFTKEVPQGLVKPVPRKPQGQGRKKGGMLKQLMKSSTISGTGEYPSSKNITGYGKIPKMAEIIKEVMEKKGCKMAEAKRFIKEAKMKGKGISGGHWYDDLWSGIKKGADFVAPLVPFIV